MTVVAERVAKLRSLMAEKGITWDEIAKELSQR